MGGICCNTSSNVLTLENEKHLVAPKEQKLSDHQALSASNDKLHTRRQSSTKGMTRLAMKFPHIRKSFRSCKHVFDECAGDRQYITFNEVRPLLIQLGAKSLALTDEEMEIIFNTSDLSKNQMMDFREFLIAAAVGCFLKEQRNESSLSQEFLFIRKGFEVAREAFDTIDTDGSGEIDFEELKAAFVAMSHGSQDELIQTRLEEMDFNGDQAIEFPEFVWGLTSWVGIDADGADDEYGIDDNTTKNANNALPPRVRLSIDGTNNPNSHAGSLLPLTDTDVP